MQRRRSKRGAERIASHGPFIPMALFGRQTVRRSSWELVGWLSLALVGSRKN